MKKTCFCLWEASQPRTSRDLELFVVSIGRRWLWCVLYIRSMFSWVKFRPLLRKDANIRFILIYSRSFVCLKQDIIIGWYNAVWWQSRRRHTVLYGRAVDVVGNNITTTIHFHEGRMWYLRIIFLRGGRLINRAVSVYTHQEIVTFLISNIKYFETML